MKIEKLNDEEVVYVLDLTKKINEIIDILNKSFITDEPDTINILHDTAFDIDLNVDNNMTYGDSIIGDAKCPYIKNITCPHCGVSHYMELYSTSTAMYYPPTYKDGVNINPDMNKAITHCECLNCGKEFDI